MRGPRIYIIVVVVCSHLLMVIRGVSETLKIFFLIGYNWGNGVIFLTNSNAKIFLLKKQVHE